MARMLRRDDGAYDMTYGPPTIIFVALLLLAGCCVGSLVLLRRRRRQRRSDATTLPTHQRSGNGRTFTIATKPSSSRGESVLVYDEKMNLIANSNGPAGKSVPEIHVTFPEEEDHTGQRSAGRVVILRISDTGSVGMQPLHREALPPYQQYETERLQSIDLERIGGLREKSQSTPQRYS